MDQREQNLRLKEAFERGITYKSYSELLQQYARKGKTSGEQKASFIEYTKLAAARQRRWEKTYRPEVNFIDAIYDCKVKGEQWLVFTETWCGDAAHALPFFNEWAIATKIPLRIVFRDEHPELMDQFLTDGGRSIPKWVRLNDHFKQSPIGDLVHQNSPNTTNSGRLSQILISLNGRFLRKIGTTKTKVAH